MLLKSNNIQLDRNDSQLNLVPTSNTGIDVTKNNTNPVLDLECVHLKLPHNLFTCNTAASYFYLPQVFPQTNCCSFCRLLDGRD
jgi:hypothetical protein